MADEVRPNAEAVPAGDSAAPNDQNHVTPVPDAVAEEKSRIQRRIDQLTAAKYAAEERARLAEERAMQIEQERSTVVPGVNRPGVKAPEMVGDMTKEQWLAWHDEDPLAASEFVADIRAEAKAQQFMTRINQASAVVNTVNEVYKSHPELKEVMEGRKSPEEVPFWQVYDEVAKEMPEAAQMARGPILVMKEAERRVKEREMEKREKDAATNAAQEENDRQQRVGASHTLGSSGRPPSAGSAKLSPEEERIARKMGMTPEEYAKNKGGK